MSVSAIYILDAAGKVLISRDFRGDIPMGIISRFSERIAMEGTGEDGEGSGIPPIFIEDGVTFLNVRRENLFFVATTDSNVNAAAAILFLYRVIEVLKHYFNAVCEESIRDNFVVIYELFDEMGDFGYPQTTDPKMLSGYILEESHKMEGVETAQAMLKMVTGAVSWRPDSKRYQKNEVFLDVVESINLLVSSSGQVLKSEIIGAIKMNVRLSGMPELRLGLNDKVQLDANRRGRNSATKSVEMEDVTFHQCVRLSRFENNHAIVFVPPDGEFELMHYRLNTQVRPLIWIEAIIDKHEHSRVEMLIKAKSQFRVNTAATNVQVIIPVPADAFAPKFKCSIGSCQHHPEDNAMVWTIKNFPGGREFLTRAHFDLPSITTGSLQDKKRPIQVKFEIPYFTVSGVQVRYLKIVEKSGYTAMPWVRYLTQSGEYQIRT